jgi:hypothetical protein
LEIAIKSGDSTKIAEAQAKLGLANREVGLSDRKLANAQTNLGIQDELSGNAQATLGAKQQAERIGFNDEQQERESEAGLALAGVLPKGNRRTFGPRRAERNGGARKKLEAKIRANEGATEIPTSKPVEIPGATAPNANNKAAAFSDSLRTAVSGVEARLDKIAQELGKPRVENLYVSSPQPVSDAGSILSDIAYQSAVGAGLG